MSSLSCQAAQRGRPLANPGYRYQPRTGKRSILDRLGLMLAAAEQLLEASPSRVKGSSILGLREQSLDLAPDDDLHENERRKKARDGYAATVAKRTF